MKLLTQFPSKEGGNKEVEFYRPHLQYYISLYTHYAVHASSVHAIRDFQKGKKRFLGFRKMLSSVMLGIPDILEMKEKANEAEGDYGFERVVYDGFARINSIKSQFSESRIKHSSFSLYRSVVKCLIGSLASILLKLFLPSMTFI